MTMIIIKTIIITTFISELVWAWVKARVAKENKTFKVKDVVELVKKILREVPVELWQNAIRHCRDREEFYWKKDRLVDVQVK